jgi:hypothetical protein
MKIEKFKTLILLLLIGLSIYQTSQLWLEPLPQRDDPNEKEIVFENIYIWDKIKPEKISVVERQSINTYKEDYCDEIWYEFIQLLPNFTDIETQVSEVDNIESFTVKISMPNPIPRELLTQGIELENEEIMENIKFINKFYLTEDKTQLVVENNEGRYISLRANEEIERAELEASINKIGNETEYIYGTEVKGVTLNSTIPVNEKIMNPVIVKSEINIENEEYITEIAENYYGENYDYVRKSVESSSVNYVYRNEKVLRINSDGLLEFYNTAENSIGEDDIYQSFLIGLNFIEDFLGYPENAYLSQVESIQIDGNYGYRFSFDYKMLNRPIIFSQVRDEKALEIEVVGGEVVLYKRFIRVIDSAEPSLMEEITAMNPLDILNENIELLAVIYMEENNSDLTDEEIIQNNILNSIEEVYLGYYDPSRKLSEQLIRSVWVMKTPEERYIFNAITGNLIEIQNLN